MRKAIVAYKRLYDRDRAVGTLQGSVSVKMVVEKSLQLADYVVFCLGIFASLAAGMFFAYRERKHVSSFYFHRGGGKLGALPVAMSMLVTFESSIFYLGYPAEVYVHGFIFWFMNVGMAIAFLTMFLITIPMFYPLQVTSVFEYLQMRHDSLLIRQVAMALSTLFMVLYAGIVLFGAAVALQSVTGVAVWIYIVSMSAIAIVYTSLGGIKAVVITDVVQGVIMIVMIFVVLIYGTMRAGGVQTVIGINRQSGRLNMNNFDPSPLTRHTFWTLAFGGATRFVGFCCRPPVIQRLNSTKSMKEAKKVAALSIPGFIILQTLVMAEGLVAYAYFVRKGCDPLASGQISNPNQIISFAVMDMFESIPGLTGLFLSALCSASLSTISSLLSSVSAIVSEDAVRARRKTISEVTLTNLSKLIVILCGIVCIAVGLLISTMKGPIPQITGSVLGAIDGPMTALFFMSFFIKFTTRKGLLASIAAGVAFGLWMSLGFNFSPGRKVTPWLPLGPIDKCYNVTEEGLYFNHSMLTSTYATTFNNMSTYDLSLQRATITEGNPEKEQKLHGLDNLYSISYMYIALLVTLVTLAVGIPVSLATKLERKTPIPTYLMLSLNKRFFRCEPHYDDVLPDPSIEVENIEISKALVIDSHHNRTENKENGVEL